MKEAFKKQVLIGIGGVAAVVLIALAAYRLWGMPANRWVMYAALAVLTAGFFGSLWYIFGGMRSFFNGAGYGFGFVALTVSAKELPSWGFGILIVAAVLFFVVRPLIKQYKRDREKGSPAVINEKAAAEVRQEEAIETAVMEADDELKRSIAFGEKSLLLLTNLTGAFCQLIRGGDALYLARLGGELTGIDEALLRTDFTDETDYIRGSKDVRIGFGEIVSIHCRYRKEVGTQLENCGRLTIKTDNKRYTFAILETLPLQQLKTFFSDLPFTVSTKKQTDAPARKLSEEEQRILPLLKKACLALTVISLVAAAAFWFLPAGPVVYRILSGLCMLIPVVTGVLYARFDTLLSVEDKSNDDAVFKKTGVNIMLPLLLPSAALMIRTIYDFTVTDWVDMLIWSGALAAAILLLLFTFTTEYKRKKTVIIMFVMVALFYAPSAVVQVNGLYDTSAPTVYESPLLDKHISDGRSSTFYYFTVELDDGSEKDIGVTPDYYKAREPGDSLTVVEQSGLLGIDYVYIDESE